MVLGFGVGAATVAGVATVAGAAAGRAEAEELTLLLADFDFSLRVVLGAPTDGDAEETDVALEEVEEEARDLKESGRRSSNPKLATLG